jgi:hypothetical protein
VFGYQDRDAEGEDLIDPYGRGAPFWFQQMGERRSERNRIHIDMWVPAAIGRGLAPAREESFAVMPIGLWLALG